MEKFYYYLIVVFVIVASIGIWHSVAYRDIDMLESKAPSFIENRGYKITSYDGYEGNAIHGGFVWYQARDKNDYLYEMAVGEWRSKLMLYNVACLNAVTNNRK